MYMSQSAALTVALAAVGLLQLQLRFVDENSENVSATVMFSVNLVAS